MEKKYGILVQGSITEWTSDIIEEHKVNFPDCDIVLSTWITDDVKDIDCTVVKSTMPKKTSPHYYDINERIVVTNAGLEKINADIIMKCRTDQFVHNSDIFKIYEKSCKADQIMVPYEGLFIEKHDYFISDMCQIAKHDLLNEYWNPMPEFDGSYAISPEVYFTKNYVINLRNDKNLWRDVITKYFCLKGFHEHFQIEWEEMTKFEGYQKSKEKWAINNEIIRKDDYIKLIGD